ncbi:glycoside hydrolase [Dacryopinax primogenitus]|uniref:glucan endo-1,3-beta-D-glucosidase n=1 Tax=Dacryopinax primogenitus (strain DJM 731) TaxID=1858805 RepID=M5G9S7_DACPD|nr:glycoside hydrolase [Dacryopinax primogenitus]EJU05045.1 glycoside hydrolase [Dacryopinax primogenitus]
MRGAYPSGSDRSPFADPSGDLVPQFDSQMHSPLGRGAESGAMYGERFGGAGGNGGAGGGYRNYDTGNSEWLEKQQASSKRNKMLIIVGILVVVIAVVAGIVAGVVISKHNSSSSSSGTSSGGSSSGGSNTESSGGGTAGQGVLRGSAGVVQLTDPNDASTYIKDPRLKNSFYGFAYTPMNVQLPWCGAVQANVTEDVILLSQLTTRIRLYGADCNQSALVLEGIQQSKVNLSVYLAIYVTDNTTSYEEQKQKVLDAITTYGVDHVEGVAVGNEFILNNLTDLNLSDPNSTAGISAADYLISLMADTRQSIQALGLSKTIPVGTADAGSMITPHLLTGADFGMANVHPWFGNVAIDQAAGWTYDFFEDFDVAPSLATTNKPPVSIAETGWPTASSSVADETDGPSTASVANLQTFMNDFVCPSNQNGTQYFFFEYFDEPWKDAEFGGVEGWWGVFTSNKQLKNLTIPDCTHS